ncbi:hypothetical protein A3K72_01820 [Candidatus Woesearchaeota archaeon RBG_13_36_6]|nr:MAG: hypothetical protein A3K72_01820 [Candidatus Woesearchaeota archaeon RBG_13_36_6]
MQTIINTLSNLFLAFSVVVIVSGSTLIGSLIIDRKLYSQRTPYKVPYSTIQSELTALVEDVPQEGNRLLPYESQIGYYTTLIEIIDGYIADNAYPEVFKSNLYCDILVPRIVHTQEMDQIMQITMKENSFNSAAIEYLSQNFTLRVLDSATDKSLGGLYCPNHKAVFSPFQNQKTIVHELAHAWYTKYIGFNIPLQFRFVADVVNLANMDPHVNPMYTNAIALAHDYVYGDTFQGFIRGFEDPNNLTYFDLFRLTDDPNGLPMLGINDDEMFAGLASFTMGRYYYGEDSLPPFMWKYFRSLFNEPLSYKDY